MQKKLVSILPLLLWVSVCLGNQPPTRIISLAPSLTQEIFLLGSGHRLVGDTRYCVVPEAAKHVEKVATAMEVNVEKVVRLRPDLVVATSLTSPETITTLKKMGLKVEVFPQPLNYAQICEQFMRLASRLGKTKCADSIVAASKERLDALRSKHTPTFHPAVFMEIGTKPLFTAIGGTFLDDFITQLGGSNIAHDATSGLYSREEVLRQNPDVIIIVTMGIAGREEKKRWEQFPKLKAVQNHQVFIVDSYQLCSPTPVSFIDGLEKVDNLIHQHQKNKQHD
ncbi:ABC transporter substrate-binding protein [Prolixibacter sp. NT017]|uniref:ABC transporter substrate-binding protein n=1 Tax=Prolixibacter sp. NT017 TaxID=2652390 RepID=UPI0012739BFC|nr:helical backbone metal receptor [Prolixibacter sp. NT017]GET25634.1 cobalamin-binding protein [Prolixibacter sp. NT017]